MTTRKELFAEVRRLQYNGKDLRRWTNYRMKFFIRFMGITKVNGHRIKVGETIKSLAKTRSKIINVKSVRGEPNQYITSLDNNTDAIFKYLI